MVHTSFKIAKMKPNITSICFYVTILVITLIGNSIAQQARVVFPHDIVRFSCKRPSVAPRSTECSWSFTVTGDRDQGLSPDLVKAKCTKPNKSSRDEPENSIYEGYVEVPERAMSIRCNENEVENTPELLDVQNVKVANPLTRINQDTSKPSIILQRFSKEDFGVRFAAHDVTDTEVKLNGKEVDSVKLFCIHSEHVTWKSFSLSRRRVLDSLNARDSKWLRTRSNKLEKIWQEYLRLLLDDEIRNSQDFEVRIFQDEVMYTAPLSIRNVTNSTSRLYECLDVNNNQSTSFVHLSVEDPKSVGPDEIQLIEQIITILDSSQSKGPGNEPWAALGSVLSIMLVISLYYLKKKIDERRTNNSPSQCGLEKHKEETEARKRLQPTTSQQSEQQSNDQNNETLTSVTAL